jgi:hypothetical protein
MKLDLKNNWNIDAVTMYDRPVRQVAQTANKDAFLEKYNQRKIEED